MRKAITFDDVLLVPKFCGFESRKEVDISTKIGDVDLKIPIISANMDTITGPEMAWAMHRLGGLGILHRFCSIEDNVAMYKDSPSLTGVSIGANEGMDRARKLFDAGARIFCVDMAHGHSKLMAKTIAEIKGLFGNTATIIAGNICTSSGADSLVGWGAGVIKAGIGGGCFVSGTKVKTNNKSRPIEKIRINDYVLTHTGQYKRVIGVSERLETGTIMDINGIKCTKEHKFYVVHKRDVSIITDENIHEHAKWVMAQDLSEDYCLIKIKKEG